MRNAQNCLHVLFTGLILFTSSAAFSQASTPLNTYSIRLRIPQLQTSCAEEAQLLTQTFAAATNAKETHTDCVSTTTLKDSGQTYTLNILLITYKAASPVTSYTAKFSPSVLPAYQIPDSSVGTYAKYSDCLAERDNQITSFQAQTKLIAAYSNCEPSNTLEEVSYVLQITGFGKREKSLYVFKSFEFSSQEDALAVEALLNQFGASVTQKSGPLFFYYAPSALNISHYTMANFSAPEECTRQLDAAAKIYTAAGAKAIIPRCIVDSYNFSNIEVVSYGSPNVHSNLGFGSEQYFSFEECLQDLPRALEQAPKLKAVWGGLCTRYPYVSGRYQVELYSNY